MVIDIHDVWQNARLQHETYVNTHVHQALAGEYARGPATKVLLDFQFFLDVCLNDIISSDNTDFENVITSFQAIFPVGGATEKEADALARRVFNYDAFRAATANAAWDTYRLCLLARYKICPYCHIHSTETVTKNGALKGYRGDLDHYLARTHYPYLALSLGNLIVSCELCNGSKMKHQKDFRRVPHLHPLKDSSGIQFKLRPAGGAAWTPTLRAFRERMDNYEIEVTASNGSVQALNSLKTFQLSPRYQPHLNDAYRVAKVGRNPGWVNSLLKVTGIALSIKDQLGFTPATDEYKHVPVGKMRRDVYLASRTQAGDG
ncbi:hypothetical protein CR51_02095 [Caballeronia megalochromosomata]|nr:hypothetical protein CR51_02095 [Caballeronia megalochromosomata]